MPYDASELVFVGLLATFMSFLLTILTMRRGRP